MSVRRCPLPYAHPEGIMFMDTHDGQRYQQPASWPAFVEEATRDIGVRMALGATRKRILALVLSRVAWMLLAGAIVGLVLTVVERTSSGWSSTSTCKRKPATSTCWHSCWW
jgi:hypothetical protein